MIFPVLLIVADVNIYLWQPKELQNREVFIVTIGIWFTNRPQHLKYLYRKIYCIKDDSSLRYELIQALETRIFQGKGGRG
jgi:hypothetical protein